MVILFVSCTLKLRALDREGFWLYWSKRLRQSVFNNIILLAGTPEMEVTEIKITGR